MYIINDQSYEKNIWRFVFVLQNVVVFWRYIYFLFSKIFPQYGIYFAQINVFIRCSSDIEFELTLKSDEDSKNEKDEVRRTLKYHHCSSPFRSRFTRTISIPFQISSPDIADKLSIALISHARNAPRYAP